MKNIIKTDDIEYVKKEVPDENNYVIVRSKDSGVHAGILVEKNDLKSGLEVVLKNARRIYYWSGAATLSQLSIDGVKNPDQCLFPQEVDRIFIMGVCEIIPCKQKAIESIKGVPVWKK